MRVAPGMLLLSFALVGCHTAHDVAVTSFRVIDAPANYVRRRLDDGQTTTTTTTTTSDVVTNPGRPVDVAPPPPPPPQRRTVTRATSTADVTSRASTQHNATTSESGPRTSSAAPSRKTSASSQPQYPTAKPVPGKPGFVFSPYDANGGYVDVTGYASGSKAKDPYSQKIFIVP